MCCGLIVRVILDAQMSVDRVSTCKFGAFLGKNVCLISTYLNGSRKNLDAASLQLKLNLTH